MGKLSPSGFGLSLLALVLHLLMHFACAHRTDLAVAVTIHFGELFSPLAETRPWRYILAVDNTEGVVAHLLLRDFSMNRHC
jgi:hypothetical protein